MNATNGSALERQLDALLTPTTIADLARQGGSIKTMKERELRELIRHALLTLMQSSTSVAAPDQEQLLDQVQGELQRTLAATAAERAEQEALRAELAHATTAMGNLSLRLAEAEQAAATLRAEVLAAQSEAAMPGAPAAWAHAIDAQWFAGRHQRQHLAGASLLESLADHLTACQQLLAEYPATPPGVDAAGDVIARIETLLALRKQDQHWLAELQKRQGAMLAEREKLRAERESGHAARDEGVARTLAAEAQANHLAEQVAALQQRIVDLEARPTETDPAAVWNEELAELRERIAESQAHLEAASAARIRAERELASTATGRATAERRLAESDSRVTELTTLLQTLEAQLTDQRKITDIARLASIETEALRAEIEGLKLLLREREAVLADERARGHADRDRHRTDNATRLEAMRRVELALMQFKDQLAAAERLLAEGESERALLLAEVEQLRSRPAAVPAMPLLPERDAEIAALAGELAAARTRAQEAELRCCEAERSARQAAAEAAGLRAQQADAVAVQEERDWLRQALLAFAPAQHGAAPAAPASPAPTPLSTNPVHAVPSLSDPPQCSGAARG